MFPKLTHGHKQLSLVKLVLCPYQEPFPVLGTESHGPHAYGLEFCSLQRFLSSPKMKTHSVFNIGSYRTQQKNFTNGEQ